ncbi:MAG: hypothetical protein HQK62_14115, partial [Desulfamplus sp.]|nr:hypothetical protein [Desulfamplus sp.]
MKTLLYYTIMPSDFLSDISDCKTEKKIHGGDRKSGAIKSNPQNGNLISDQPTTKETTSTAGRLVDEKGCGKNTVLRSEKFADAVDTLAEVIAPEVKQEILSGKVKIMAWMANNQLGRRNITEEQKKYLLGKLYEMEKKILSNAKGNNQYTVTSSRVKWIQYPLHPSHRTVRTGLVYGSCLSLSPINRGKLTSF